MAEAILWGKRKKEDELKSIQDRLREDENRKRLLQTTSYDLVKSLMIYRAEKKFDEKFILDENNKLIFEILCNYFGNDENFNSLCKSVGIENTSLNKGIFLAGNFGVGKTWMMKLFRQNQRQCFFIKPAKDIADEFMQEGDDFMDEYINTRKNALNDSSVFLQPYSGICIDDLGTEDIKNHFGNKKNVIGDIIEKKYARSSVGVFLHATTNLTADQLKDFYGGRVTSRMREIFNFIELRGKDRRK
jgi:predicted ATPase